MMDYKVIPHPIHEIEDEWRRKDEVETRLREIEENFTWLMHNGYRNEALDKWQEWDVCFKLTERLMGGK